MTETLESIKPIVLTSKVKATERYRVFLQVASLFMKNPLTPVEISIIDEFYHAESGLITTGSRKTVRENLNISAGQLNNYIRELRIKKIIIEDSLNPRVLQPLPEVKEENGRMRIIINLDVVL
jgi:poly-beta-hydroxyalkanoate depolymerase